MKAKRALTATFLAVSVVGVGSFFLTTTAEDAKGMTNCGSFQGPTSYNGEWGWAPAGWDDYCVRDPGGFCYDCVSWAGGSWAHCAEDQYGDGYCGIYPEWEDIPNPPWQPWGGGRDDQPPAY